MIGLPRFPSLCKAYLSFILDFTSVYLLSSTARMPHFALFTTLPFTFSGSKGQAHNKYITTNSTTPLFFQQLSSSATISSSVDRQSACATPTQKSQKSSIKT
jgi:hypothetical protein